MTREPIYSALFALLSGAANFQTTSRVLKHWSDVPAGSQPALFMAQVSERAQTVRGQPTIWLLDTKIYLYAQSPDPNTSGATILNPLLDAVVASLKPSFENLQTLGGLVNWARVEGEIITDEGWLGQQAIAIVPVLVSVPT